MMTANTPELLLGILQRGNRVMTARGGLTRLFELMVETEDIPVIFHQDVNVSLAPQKKSG